MAGEFAWDDAVRALRGALAVSRANVRAFGMRAAGRPGLLTPRQWAELAAIEERLAALLTDALRRELRVEPWTFTSGLRALARTARDVALGERAQVERLLAESRTHPVEDWRAAAPGLEKPLWSLMRGRTRHLANTAALALNEPAPYPPLFWHPARGEFVARDS
jgi:hypothetical protein